MLRRQRGALSSCFRGLGSEAQPAFASFRDPPWSERRAPQAALGTAGSLAASLGGFLSIWGKKEVFGVPSSRSTDDPA